MIVQFKQWGLNLNLRFMAVALVAGLTFQSCLNDDDYQAPTYRTLGLVKKSADNTFFIRSDNGDTLTLENNISPYFTLRDSQRVLTDFLVKDIKANTNTKYVITVKDIHEVLFKNPRAFTTTNVDSIGNDKVHVNFAWAVRDMLNFDFVYRGGGTETHFINLAYTPQAMGNNPDTLRFELRHNSSKDPYLYEIRSIASFNLAPFKQEGRDSLTIQIKSTNWYGEVKTSNCTYKY